MRKRRSVFSLDLRSLGQNYCIDGRKATRWHLLLRCVLLTTGDLV